jgi:hypothetical protein
MLSEDELDDLIADTRFQQGRNYERDRATKLLNQLRCEKPHDCRKWHDHYGYSPDELIEILKGEVD